MTSAMPCIRQTPNSPWTDAAWSDNVFVKRLWRSVKYERVHIKSYDSVNAANADITEYLLWYNSARPHSSLPKQTPDESYAPVLPEMLQAA
jgi:putative transposase